MKQQKEARPRVIEAKDVGKLIKDGDTVTPCGVGGTMVSDITLASIEASFLATGHPRDLTLVYPCPFGHPEGDGLDRFAHEGLLRRVIGSSYHSGYVQPKLCALVRENRIEGYVLPLGVFYKLIRDISAGLPGTFSYVGLGTIIDPRYGGGRLNEMTKEDIVELVNVQGREMLFYKGFPIDVAIIHGTTADEDGNISLEEEPLTLEPLHQAMAAHNRGGIVICQVRRLAARGSLNPRTVEVPGILVDYIVVDPNQRQQTHLPGYDPAISGEIRIPEPPIKLQPLDEEKVICRRALMQLAPNIVLNLGAGLPNRRVALVAREEGVAQQIHISVEHGALGGLNLSGSAHVNPTSLLTACDIMDLYHGGGLDWSFLGFMEVDRLGNVNLGRLGNTIEGPGGCIDISASTPKVAFLSTFTYGGLKVEVGGGKLRIITEGKTRKFVKNVQGIFYNSEYGKQKGQQIRYITERAVFELRDEGIALIEVAPGIDLEKDVLGQMEFRPTIATDLKEMSPDIFREPYLGIVERYWE